MKSWQTTMAGILAAVAILCVQAAALLDSDPATNPAYGEVVAALGLLGIGWFARDNNVSSEDAGAK